MATKKKRNKQYKGSGAATPIKTVRVSAVKRNPINQYWVDHKRMARPVGIAAGIVLVLLIIIVGLISIFVPH